MIHSLNVPPPVLPSSPLAPDRRASFETTWKPFYDRKYTWQTLIGSSGRYCRCRGRPVSVQSVKGSPAARAFKSDKTPLPVLLTLPNTSNGGLIIAAQKL